MTENYNIEKLAKTSRRSAIVSLLAFLLIIFALVYSSINLMSLQKKISKGEAKLDSLNLEFVKRQKQISEMETMIAAYKDFTYHVGLENPNLTRKALQKTVEADQRIARLLPRIILHIRSESQQDAAKRIAEILQNKGYIVVPDFEKVNVGPSKTQVRFFRINNQEEKSEASEIAQVLEGFGIKNVESAPIGGYETSVPPKQYEIWFSPDAFK